MEALLRSRRTARSARRSVSLRMRRLPFDAYGSLGDKGDGDSLGDEGEGGSLGDEGEGNSPDVEGANDMRALVDNVVRVDEFSDKERKRRRDGGGVSEVRERSIERRRVMRWTGVGSRPPMGASLTKIVSSMLKRRKPSAGARALREGYRRAGGDGR